MRRSTVCRLFGFLTVLLTPACLVACLWDTDTIQMERQRFPSTLELITGKFLRHSPEFYEWRIQDRLRKLESDPGNAAWLDDLAVAYDKIGQHDKAIEVMLRKADKYPNTYETEANLGTFYIHNGELEKGLQHIERALATNPDAHFGREEYQKLLVEYVLTRRRDGKIKTPLRISGDDDKAGWDFSQPHDFAGFVARYHGADKFTEEERQGALKGVLGMMKFGNHRSPILLEALADLLRDSDNRGQDAKRLASRAYLKASYESKDRVHQAAYRGLALEALSGQTRSDGTLDPLPLAELEQDFQTELAEAEEWYNEVRQNELAWIEQGRDPEERFAATYYDDPSISSATDQPFLPSPAALYRNPFVAIGIAIVVVLAIPTGIGLALFLKMRSTIRRARSVT